MTNLMVGFFRIEEVSNKVYEVEGLDLYRRLVSMKGTEPEELLSDA